LVDYRNHVHLFKILKLKCQNNRILGVNGVRIKFRDAASRDDLDPTFLSLSFVSLSALVFWAVYAANSKGTFYCQILINLVP
ncbi:hypothetical protein RYX36_026100, partial [Vicia faba]